MFNQKGQISLNWIIGLGASVVVAFAGSMLTQNNVFNSKIDNVNVKVNTSERDITRLQTQSTQYQKDIEGINKKLDEILKRLK
mgnify:CR=1 FL=1